MAQQIMLICDSCQSTEGVTNVRFAYEGQAHEIDVCTKHAEEFAKAMQPWLEDARPVGFSPRVKPVGEPREYDPQVVRAWAQGNGIEVSAKGRVSADVVEKWKAAGSPA